MFHFSSCSVHLCILIILIHLCLPIYCKFQTDETVSLLPHRFWFPAIISARNCSGCLCDICHQHHERRAPHISLDQWKKKFAWMQLLQKCRNVTIVDLIESESVNSLTAPLPEYQMKRTSVKLRSIMTTGMIKHPRSQNKVCICSSQPKRAPFLPESVIESQSSL